jgi:hypothetical protein
MAFASCRRLLDGQSGPGAAGGLYVEQLSDVNEYLEWSRREPIRLSLQQRANLII